MLSCWHDLLFLFCLLLFYLFLPSMGWLCGVGVIGLIECPLSLPALHSGLQNDNNNNFIIMKALIPFTFVNIWCMNIYVVMNYHTFLSYISLLCIFQHSTFKNDMCVFVISGYNHVTI